MSDCPEWTDKDRYHVDLLVDAYDRAMADGIDSTPKVVEWPEPEQDPTPVVCPRRFKVSRSQCNDRFREAHRATGPGSPCWRCRMGARRDLVDHWDLPPLEHYVSALVEYVSSSEPGQEVAERVLMRAYNGLVTPPGYNNSAGTSG